MAVTPQSLARWVAAVAPLALSMRMLPGDFALLVDPTIPHTFPPKDDFSNALDRPLSLAMRLLAFGREARELVSLTGRSA